MGKQVRIQGKREESAKKKARLNDTDNEVDSVGEGESVREKGEKPGEPEVRLFHYLKLTLLT